MHKKDRLKILIKFIEPSLLELLSIFAIFGVLFIANQTHRFYSANLTSLGATSFKGTFLNGFSHWLSSLYDSKDFSIVAVYIFWLFIALLVYVMAFRVTNNAKEITQDIKIRHYLWPKGADRNSPIKRYFEKFGIKLIILITLCLYIMKLSPPILNWWKHHYILTNSSAHSLAIYLTLLAFIALYIHGLIVLIRIFILRLRIVNI